MIQQIQQLQQYFNSGATKSYAFRKKQLLALKNAVIAHEAAIYDALYSDLKKSKEECWVTENGFLLSEINATLANLAAWMKPQRVSTNLLNLPSTSEIHHEPLGVVLIIGPWNYPLQLLLTPLVGAIAAGNCVVLKPSEFAPATAAVIKKIIAAAFDEQQVIVIEGDGATVVPQMMEQFVFDHVFYTGSTVIGKKIYEMAARQLVPVTLELGGKSPCVVEADANIKVAAKRIAVIKFSNCGQMCVAPDYILVHESKKQALVDELKKCIDAFYNNPKRRDDSYGKIINEKQFNRIISYLKDGTIIYGGKYDAASLFIEPTLLDNVSLDSNIMKEEIFGPLLPIISFTKMEDALAIISTNKNPLAFYVFTQSDAKEKQWLDAVPAGGVCINNASWHLTNHNLPFGGRGYSGTGRYHGYFSFETFSHKKAVLKTPTWFDPSVKYPPFKGKLNIFKWFIR